MDRSASKVPDIWWKWREGRGGKPSVLSLNDRYGSDWRKGDKNVYSRRKKLIDEIDYVASTQNRDPLEVVQSFEDVRVARSLSIGCGRLGSLNRRRLEVVSSRGIFEFFPL